MLENSYIYLLTPLTRNANQDRRIVVKGFDLNRRHFFLFMAGFVPISLVTAAFWNLLGQYSLFLWVIMYAILFWLVETRTENGLQLRRYQALLDSKISPTGKFLLCGAEVNPGISIESKIISASVPTKVADDEVDVHGTWTDDSGLFSMPAARN